jgi:hypothetical protein
MLKSKTPDLQFQAITLDIAAVLNDPPFAADVGKRLQYI